MHILVWSVVSSECHQKPRCGCLNLQPTPSPPRSRLSWGKGITTSRATGGDQPGMLTPPLERAISFCRKEPLNLELLSAPIQMIANDLVVINVHKRVAFPLKNNSQELKYAERKGNNIFFQFCLSIPFLKNSFTFNLGVWWGTCVKIPGVIWQEWVNRCSSSTT